MNTPKAWIGTSWKMNKTLGEAMLFAQALAGKRFDDAIRPFILPPFTVAREVKAALAETPVKIGAQNMHWADAGAWTGEISPLMLKDCGLDLVELGHSERRQHFGETDESVGRKVAAAVKHGLTSLVCIGETEGQKERGLARDVLSRQVESALQFLDMEGRRNGSLIFAYEPIWAIGESGSPASPAYASSRHRDIKETAQNVLGREVPCIYGGSVNGGNCAALIGEDHIDGLFIGRAGWAPEGYLDIIDICTKLIGGEARPLEG